MGIFPLDDTGIGTVHLLAFVIAFGSAIPACLIFAIKSKQNLEWQPYGVYSLLTGAFATFLFLMLLVVWPTHDDYKGLWQALLTAVILLWVIVTAAETLRSPSLFDVGRN